MVSLRKAMDIARCARQDPLYGGIVFDCKPEEAFETVKVLRDEVVRLNDDLRAERMINLHAGPVLGPLKAEVERLRALVDSVLACDGSANGAYVTVLVPFDLYDALEEASRAR